MSTTEPLAPQPPRPRLSLASVRERVGITLEEIAQSTLIAVHYLRAIEAEEFAKLPAGVYATSYIRQYAQRIGYSQTALLDQYHARIQEEPAPSAATQSSLRVAKEPSRWWFSAKPRTQHPA